MALPVLGPDGEVDRVAIAALDLTWLSTQLQERGLPPGGSVTVADRSGVVVARAPLAERFVGTRIPDAFLPLLNAPEPGSLDLVSQDGTRRMLGYVPLEHGPRGLYVSAGLSTEGAFSVVDRSTLIGFLLIGVGPDLRHAGGAGGRAPLPRPAGRPPARCDAPLAGGGHGRPRRRHQRRVGAHASRRRLRQHG
jgi:hypothetical protein